MLCEASSSIMLFPAWVIFVLISFTSVSGVSVVCPSSCYCDDRTEYVSCVGDGLWRFPDRIPHTAIRLELRNYLARELTPQDLRHLITLEELKLQQSRLETVDNATFASNVRLERLDLSQNSLTSLSPSIFKDLHRLRHLDVSSNHIEFVEGAFLDLTNLEQLNLRDNKLSQLTIHSFVGLHKIQYLNLDLNNISAIEVGTFQYLTNLAHLIISNNPLQTLSRLDFFGSRLQYIDMSHVGLDRVPQSLTKFVRDLRMAKNNLTRISAGDFDSYPYLGLLVLDDNCVGDIENDALGRLEYLMRLWLNGNCLTRVPPNLPPSLLALYMEENKLTSLQEYSFKGLIHLEQLFLQRNHIQDLHPCVFCDLVSLRSLDLQANQIQNLTAGVFANLSQLETLDLSQNNLKTIDPQSFSGLSGLTTLQMSRVHTMVRIEEDTFDPLQSLLTLEVYDSSPLVQSIINSTRILHGLRKVQELNIMHNHIVKLRPDFPSFFPYLKVLKISGNMWHCDHDIKWLTNWIKQSNVQFYSSYNIRCASPPNVQLKPLMMLTDADIVEETTTKVKDTATTQVVTKRVAASTMVVYFKNPPLATAAMSPSYDEKTNQIPSTQPTFSDLASLPTHSDAHEISQSQTSLSSHLNFNDESSFSQTKQIDVTSEFQLKVSEASSELGSSSSVNAKFSSASSFESKLTSVPPSQPTLFDTSSTSKPSDTPSVLQSEPSESKHLRTEYSVILSTPTLTTKLRSVTSPHDVTAFARISSSNMSAHSQNPSPLRGLSEDHLVLIVGAFAGGVFLLGVVALMACRFRHPYEPVKQRRSSSISYYPQKAEVSIVTLTEGTSNSNSHGLGNKLYYIMETGPSPDSQLQELLSTENGHLY